MATRELSLFADLDEGRLVTGFLSTLQATLPRFVFGDSIPISFRPLIGNGNNALPWIEVDLTGKTVRIAIGNPAGAASSGTFTLSYDGGTTTAIAYNADGAAIQTALNALASITAAGGVIVTRASTTGAFRIVFNEVGVRTAITASTESLYPSSGAEIRVTVEGGVSAREIVVARLEALPAAYAELTEEFPVAASEIVESREGITGVTATYAACVMAFGGSIVDGDEFEIGDETFVFRAAPATDNEVLVGASDAENLANSQAKIDSHPAVSVTTEARDATSIYLLAKTLGTSGNSIAVSGETGVSFTDEIAAPVASLYGAVDFVAALGAIYSLEFTVLPYSGFYTLEINGGQTLGIPWDADASTLQAALELAPSIGSGKVLVSGEFPLFTINFDSSLGEISDMEIDMTGLVVPKGRSGFLDTNTGAMIELLNGSAQATAKLEVELYDIGDATTWTVLQTDCTVIDDVIGNSPSTTPAFPSVLEIITPGNTAPVNAYAGVKQKTTALIVGDTVGDGTIAVTITGALLVGSPVTYNVPVTDGDSPYETATTISQYLQALPEITDFYTPNSNSPDSGNVSLEADVSAANDASLNIAYTNGTATGLTPDATSTATTAGVAPIAATPAPPYIRVADDLLYIQQAGVWMETNLYPLGTAP